MGIISWIIWGLFVGLIARLLMPGRQPIGFLWTIALGVAARTRHRAGHQRPPQRGVVGLALRPLDQLARVRPEVADRLGRYSHSIAPGGLDVMSSTTRLTSRISLIIREAICSSRS